jgi:hypothetical protein
MVAELPQDKEIHVILDNYSIHKKNDDWLAMVHGPVHFHCPPASASWLNRIEIVFSLLQRKTRKGGSFESKDQLHEAIEAVIKRHKRTSKPIRWRKREVKRSQLRNTVVNLRNQDLEFEAMFGQSLAICRELLSDDSISRLMAGQRLLEKRDGVEIAREDLLEAVDNHLLLAFNPIISPVVCTYLQIVQGGIGDSEAFDSRILSD